MFGAADERECRDSHTVQLRICIFGTTFKLQIHLERTVKMEEDTSREHSPASATKVYQHIPCDFLHRLILQPQDSLRLTRIIVQLEHRLFPSAGNPYRKSLTGNRRRRK